MQQEPKNFDTFSEKAVERLIGDQGERAYREMAEQFPEIFGDVPSDSFLAIYNAAFLIGFRNAELLYRARLLEIELTGDGEDRPEGAGDIKQPPA